MSTAIQDRPMPTSTIAPPPPLETGDRLTRDEFERRYEAMPNAKAELIEGVVYMSSPLRIRTHAQPNASVTTWIAIYMANTPGVIGGSNATIRLDLDNEPQPDDLLMIDPALGGQAEIDEDDYVAGGPELVAEIAASSVSRDLHMKLNVYRRNGVREYVVWRVQDKAIDWFILREGLYEPLLPTVGGIYQSKTFPGLWLDGPALIAGNMKRVLEVLHQGLATPDHADFVARLQKK